LYEDENGAYLLMVVVPTRDSAWAIYEKEYRLSCYEKFLVRRFPSKVKTLANRILEEEKRSQVSKGGDNL